MLNIYNYNISSPHIGGWIFFKEENMKKKEILITKVKEPSGWLSCMSAHPIVHKNQNYKTAEALFQVLRFKGHPEIQKEIQDCKSPMGAKMIARRERAKLNREGVWDYAERDQELMIQCLRLKLEQYPDLKQKLIEIGDAIIIEDCTTHDREAARIWGQVKVYCKWVGQNVLGQIWM